MGDLEFIENYFRDSLEVKKNLFNDESIKDSLYQVSNTIKNAFENNKKVLFAGNGGSAAIASHLSVDLTKTAGVRAVNFNEASLLTCFSNDFGYEQWVCKAIEYYVEDKDMIILISSSGKSANMKNAARYVNKKDNFLVTFTGFDEKNDMAELANLSLHVCSSSYNMIENTHQVWLLAALDRFISKRLK